MNDFICHYHTRIAGVEPKLHTRQFILQELRSQYGFNHIESLCTYIYVFQF